jgi:hypothetical protein
MPMTGGYEEGHHHHHHLPLHPSPAVNLQSLHHTLFLGLALLLPFGDDNNAFS